MLVNTFWELKSLFFCFLPGGQLPGNALFAVSREGAVAEKPSESGNNTHFQRYSCPGADFSAGNAFFVVFS